MTDEAQQPWIDKHRPTNFSEIQGNNAAIDRLKEWAKNYPADQTPQLLEGPPGTGKTTTIEVIADWLDLQMVELNASSARKSDDIEEMASVIRNRNAEGERRVVLLDEVDSWHHASNKRPLYDALDNPTNLVFLTCNDKYDTPDAITRRCNIEEFNLGVRSRKSKLKKVAEKEGLDLTDDVLEKLAERPDLRSAINDLQVYGPSLDETGGDQRDWEMDEMDMIDAVLTGDPNLGGERPRDGIRPGEALMWLDENVKNVYRGLELAWAYEALSRADTLLMQDARIAQEAVKSVAELRLSEPYYDDEISWNKKDFPEWFRHSKPKATGGSGEAKLYRALSNYESGEMGLTDSFVRFRKVVLPQLKSLDKDEKCRLALEHRLEPEEYEVLGLTKAQYESWVEEEDPEEGDGLQLTRDASAW